MKQLFVLIFGTAILCCSFFQQSDWADVEKVFSKKGNVQDGVLKISFLRSDLQVKVGDFSVAPGLALGTWIGFMKMGNTAMMMGDLVLLDKEVSTVISKLISENLQVTAIHNHLIGEMPTIKYIHFSGSGDAVKLAEKIKAVIAVTGTPMTAAQQTQSSNPDWSKVEAILGTSGKKNGNLLQYNFARKENLTDDGMEMPAYMGMGSVLNFQMDDKRAAITGDFTLIADEVNPVLKVLTENGIAVTAMHNHMLHDNPRLFMLHFWAVDSPEKLAKGLKAALEKTNSKF